MKKNYIIPAVEVENLNVVENILEGSPSVFPEKQEGEDATDPHDPSQNLSKEEQSWGDIW